jgi:transposase
MTKYDEQFRLKVVEQYRQGTLGFKAVGKMFGLNFKLVKRWVDRYELHGLPGLSKKFSYYSAEFKLSVLQHMWANELSRAKVSAQFDIRDPGAVGKWERCYHSGGLDALYPRVRGLPETMPDTEPPKLQEPPAEDDHRSREQLVAEVNQLRMEVAYLKKLQALVQVQQQYPTNARKKRK